MTDDVVDPVLLCNDIGGKDNFHMHPTSQMETPSLDMEPGTLSIKESVRIAQSNNFMGMICNARLLVSRTRQLY